MKPSWKFFRSEASIDAFAALILLAVGLVYTSDAHRLIDISLYDESNYLWGGLTISHGLPAAQEAPFYSLWYHLLSLFNKDSIEVFYFNYRFTALLPAIAMFVALRAHKVDRLIAIVTSLGLLACPGVLTLWPRVSNFTVSVLLIGISISGVAQRNATRVVIVLTAALIASYARPEFFLSVLLLGLILAVVLYHDVLRRDVAKSVLPVALLVLFLSFVIHQCGIPIASGNRGFMAFGQHYALNWVVWHHSAVNPWTTWETIVRSDFGSANSVISAAITNPMAFAHHIFTNLRKLPVQLATFFILPHPTNFANIMIALEFLISALLISAALLWRMNWQTLKIAVARIRLAKFHAWPACILLVPGAVSVVLIAPREHYIFILEVLGVFLLMVLLFKDFKYRDMHSLRVVVLACGLALMFGIPKPVQIEGNGPRNVAVIKFLRGLGVTSKVNLLEADGGYGIYTGPNYHRVAEYDKNTPFLDFLKNAGINMIVTSEALKADVRFVHDTQWNDFVANPGKYGYVRLDIPGVDDHKVIYKTGLVRAR